MKTRARAPSAGWLGAGLALTLAVGACTGPDLISLGGELATGPERFLSPAGDDLNPGTSDSPWKTFGHALPQLEPGMTLHLLNGTYDAGTTGTLNVRCADATPGSTVPAATLAKNGAATPGGTITVRAETEHLAVVQGDGSTPPVTIDSCQNWVIMGLHVASQDVDDQQTRPDTGSVVVLDGANQHVTLDKLLAFHPNRYKHAQVIRIGDGASDVTITSSELYDFHESGIEARRSEQLVIERNYLNARQSENADSPINPPDEDGSLGSVGVRLEETRATFVQNNIVEDASIGFAVVGRDATIGADVPSKGIQRNTLQGNIVYQPATIGFRIDSQCDGANPCDASHTITSTSLLEDVVYAGVLGVSDAGSVGTVIDHLSIIDSARGVSVSKEPQNNAIVAVTTATNTLVSGYQSVGFYSGGGSQLSWTFSHCEAVGGYMTGTDYNPDDPAHVMNKVTTNPGLGTCIAYIPASSMLRTGALDDVGANVIYEYDEDGQPTTTLLWKPSFVGCGNVVRDVNDASTKSCTNVNERLNVDTDTCRLP